MTTTSSSTGTQSSLIQQLQKTSGSSAPNYDTTTADGVENRFLTLLVTQMQNQDPLNPMDNAELTTQLAQINTVKGLASMNATLEKLMSAYSDSLSMQSSAMIGKNVLSAGNSLSLGSAGALAGVSLPADAKQVTVTIKNAAGAKVLDMSLGDLKAGVTDFVWDGKGQDGNAVAQGQYTFSVAAKDASGADVTATALQLGTVSALVRTSSGFKLEMASGTQLDFDAVQQIY